MIIRGRVKSVVEGVIKRFSALGRAEEEIDNREYLQHYGLTSRPLPGAELVIIREGNVYLSIASDDRRYRLAVEEGEVALYDDLGQKVHLTRDGILAQSPTKITAIAPQVAVVAEVKVTMTTPLVEVSGQLKVTGNITSTGGEVSDQHGSMQSMRDVHNVHTHPHPGDGQPIPAPTQQM